MNFLFYIILSLATRRARLQACLGVVRWWVGELASNAVAVSGEALTARRRRRLLCGL